MIVVPIYDAIILPGANVYMKSDNFTELSKREPELNKKVVFLFAKEKQDRDDYDENSFYPIGVSGYITEINENNYLVIRTTDRVNVDLLTVTNDRPIELTIAKRADINDLEVDEANNKLEAMKGALIDFVSNFKWGTISRNYINQWHSLNEIIVAMSSWLNNTAAEKYAVVAEDSVKKRTEMIETMLYEFLEITKVTNEAATAQEEDNQKAYREQAIKKQMEYLQKELDEMHPENVTEVRKMEIKMQESDMNETARKEAEKVLNRLKQEGNNSPEYGTLYDYLDFVTSLSWKHETYQPVDLEQARKVLDEDHFGLKKVKERILQQIAVMDLNHDQKGSILCFVGAPGTGKTSIGQSIAKALHRKYVRVSLGGVRDEADIRGHRRTYIGAMPGRIMDGIHKSGVSNPVMVLDEVDKLSASYNGDPASALLEVLDPEQNSTFTDHYMNVPYDLSDVLFICTANTLDTIPEPLLNRMEVIQFNGYSATEKFEIARRHLLPKAMEAAGITADDLEVPDETIKTIISDYTMEGGVRGLKKRLDTLCRFAAVRIVEGNHEKIVVQPDEVHDYLDMKPIHHEHVLAKKKPGIVTGLAWTMAGGEILFIETMMTKGSGKLIITGQLGDVMKESAQIAITLVKSMFPEQAKCFEENDIHIHVPEGSIKKDGPSAGITLTTALASLVTGKAVDPKYAMTGEVSLRGVVMPIGGLPEKLMAASRAGISTVFIPKENVEDLKDVADEVKNNLEIIPVEEVSDVLKETGIL